MQEKVGAPVRRIYIRAICEPLRLLVSGVERPWRVCFSLRNRRDPEHGWTRARRLSMSETAAVMVRFRPATGRGANQ